VGHVRLDLDHQGRSIKPFDLVVTADTYILVRREPEPDAPASAIEHGRLSIHISQVEDGLTTSL
jgi:hypothetical protein